MQDSELYRHILGLESPWAVADVELDLKAEEIVVQVVHVQGTKFCCPECNQELSCYDHSPARRWRYLDSCQFKTMLEASIPRVNCPEHGVKQVSVPWASPNSRFTLMFAAFAIRLLQATQTVEGARTILRIGWEATWNILERAVERGPTKRSSGICGTMKNCGRGESVLQLVVPQSDPHQTWAAQEGCQDHLRTH